MVKSSWGLTILICNIALMLVMIELMWLQAEVNKLKEVVKQCECSGK